MFFWERSVRAEKAFLGAVLLDRRRRPPAQERCGISSRLPASSRRCVT